MLVSIMAMRGRAKWLCVCNCCEPNILVSIMAVRGRAKGQNVCNSCERNI